MGRCIWELKARMRSLVTAITASLIAAACLAVIASPVHAAAVEYPWILSGLDYETVFSLYYDPTHDMLYAGSYEDGVDVFDGDKWVEMTGGVEGFSVWELLYVPAHDALYAGTHENGVWRFKDGKWTDTGGGMGRSRVYTLCYDEANDLLYAGTREHGVWVFDGNTWKDTAGELEDQRVYALVYDKNSGDIYAGTRGKGIWSYDGSAWSDISGELAGYSAFSLCLRDSGTLYAGTLEIGLWRKDGSTWNDTGIEIEDEIYSLAYDEDRSLLYAGTENRGVWVFDGSTWTGTSGGFIYEEVLSLVYVSPHQTLYAGVGNFSGVWRLGPAIVSCTPPFGFRGETLDVQIVAYRTAFVDGTSKAVFSPGGITVNSTKVVDATHAVANITISADAEPGPRGVNLITGTHRPAPLAEGFVVERAWERYFYFAEGCLSREFQEYICLANPCDDEALVEITYYCEYEDKPEKQYIMMTPRSRATINVNGMYDYYCFSCSARVACDQPIVAERPMYFDYWNRGDPLPGGHAVMGAASPSTQWYFAEGTTMYGFDEWLLVFNPGYEPAELSLTLQGLYEDIVVEPAMSPNETIIGDIYVEPHSRLTLNISDFDMPTQFSLKVDSTQPVVAERSMYFDYEGTGAINCRGGHCVIGATSLSSNYYFAEGTTREGFEEWLILANFNPDPITVDAIYHFGPAQGDALAKSYEVPAKMVRTIHVPGEVGAGKDSSVTLTSPSQFLAERSVYFNDARGFDGGHCAMGAVSPATAWIFAEGYTGAGFEEWLCLYNPGAVDAAVKCKPLYEDGDGGTEYNVMVPAGTRITVYVNDLVGADRQLSSHLLSDQPIVAERSIYFDANGRQGGHVEKGYVP
jgi:hypothetical protein